MEPKDKITKSKAIAAINEKQREFNRTRPAGCSAKDENSAFNAAKEAIRRLKQGHKDE